MTTVAFALDRWDPSRGGAERAFDLFARHLVRRGHDVTICCLEQRVDPLEADADRPRCVKVAPPRIGRSVMPGRFERVLGERLVAACEHECCDLLVGLRHLPRADLLWLHGGAHQATLEARARQRGKELDAARIKGRHRVFLALEQRLLEGAARRVVCVSELVRDELERLYPASASRLHVVPNGVDLERFRPDQRESRSSALRQRLDLTVPSGAVAPPLLAFLARDPELKGLPILFGALRGLLGRSWRLVVAGPKQPDPWRAQAARAGLPAERLRFVSQVDSAELLAAADLLVHPTWRDTSGLVLLEALSSGIPAITTDVAGDCELCRSAESGAVVPPGDAVVLRAALERWLGRIERGDVDRESIRAATVSRGLDAWMAAMEEALLSL